MLSKHLLAVEAMSDGDLIASILLLTLMVDACRTGPLRGCRNLIARLSTGPKLVRQRALAGLPHISTGLFTYATSQLTRFGRTTATSRSHMA